ncbi:inorganic diphosphatase [Spiroplasma endosymbiont of 'Nebria riversi']|uniref:inorganic diphosphatase n=1 Tax=Spiroplasma endosymbiont of 'Nebria riversi' TaxID=2792084 RepID=UPI001FE3AECC|nr:inorganic diphosphatase [Spiroplasma endosymbiont of 'Nebria riversi']
MENNIVPVIIEITTGSSNKYEYNFETKRIILDRVLYGANVYPAEYGCIENTLDWDGDPLDVIALATYPTIAGCQTNVRILGALEMIDGGEIDTKLFGVLANDPHFNHLKSLKDVPEHTLTKIKNFFIQYKQLQKKAVIVKEWKDEQWALKELAHCRELYTKYNELLINEGKEKLLEKFKEIQK